MKFVSLGALLMTGALSLAAAPAFAASPISNAFMANVQANVDFLDRSSQLVPAHTQSAAVRDFAQAQASDAARIATALAEARPSDATTKLAAADTDALMTGRSVAIDDAPKGGPAMSANGRAPLGRKDLDTLAKLSDRKFDDALWLRQVDALSQLRADYQAYADDGDDPALAALAQRELPKVEHRLELLGKI